MNSLAQQGLTHEQVLRYLDRRDGIDRAVYRVEVIRDRVHIGWVEYTGFSMQCDADATVKYTGKITMGDDQHIDWVRDYFRLVMFYPAGDLTLRFDFVPLKPITITESITETSVMLEVELYDESIMLKENSIGDTVTVPKGTPYVAVIKQLMTDVGFTDIAIDPSEKALLTDRVFEAGEERVGLINELLQEMNYQTLEVDVSGTMKSTPYILPALRPAEIHYAADRHSLIIPGKTVVRDSYKRYNHFIGYCSNPELEQAWRFQHRNTSAGDPISIPNLGYTVTAPPQSFDNVPDEETLGDLVRRWANETSQSYRTASFSTAVMPHHAVSDIISIQGTAPDGIWIETGWSIDIGGQYPQMNHNLGSVSYG